MLSTTTTTTSSGITDDQAREGILKLRKRLVGAGLAHFGDEAGGLQAEEIDFLRLTGYRDEMTGSGSGSPKIRLDLVEFELRHLKEHVEKLKFNFLEMSTKQNFMQRLLDPDEWHHLHAQTIWTPGDIKALERQMEPTKAALVEAKEKTLTLEAELAKVTDHLCSLNELVGSKLGSATELANEIANLRAEIARLKPNETANPTQTSRRSVDELQAVLDDQMIRTERRRAEIEGRRQALQVLAHQLSLQQSAVQQMEAEEALLKQQLAVKAKAAAEDRDGRSTLQRQLGELGAWYRDLATIQTELTGCKAELVRPDYLLLTVSSPDGSASVPVHLKVCPATGRLTQVQIGSTSSTPKRQWKEVIEMAIESNSIAYLARQVRAALCVSP